MPINGAILGQQLLLQLQAKGFTGVQSPAFAVAIGNGIITNILATNIYNGVTTGSMGPGVGLGFIAAFSPGPVVGQTINSQMIIRGLTGAQNLNMCMAIGQALVEHLFTFGIINSAPAPPAPPVAIGSGIGTITGVLGPALGQSIGTFLQSSGFVGTQMFNMALAIGEGIAISMASAAVNTTIIGTPVIPVVPTVGNEIGKLT